MDTDDSKGSGSLGRYLSERMIQLAVFGLPLAGLAFYGESRIAMWDAENRREEMQFQIDQRDFQIQLEVWRGILERIERLSADYRATIISQEGYQEGSVRRHRPDDPGDPARLDQRRDPCGAVRSAGSAGVLRSVR